MGFESMTATVIVVVSIISWVIVSIVGMVVNKRAHWGKDGNAPVPPLFEKMFEKSITDRDEKIRKLEARVEVLERIATDTHSRGRLSDEIENLR